MGSELFFTPNKRHFIGEYKATAALPRYVSYMSEQFNPEVKAMREAMAMLEAALVQEPNAGNWRITTLMGIGSIYASDYDETRYILDKELVTNAGAVL